MKYLFKFVALIGLGIVVMTMFNAPPKVTNPLAIGFALVFSFCPATGIVGWIDKDIDRLATGLWTSPLAGAMFLKTVLGSPDFFAEILIVGILLGVLAARFRPSNFYTGTFGALGLMGLRSVSDNDPVSIAEVEKYQIAQVTLYITPIGKAIMVLAWILSIYVLIFISP